jgi:hypothetical protein
MSAQLLRSKAVVELDQVRRAAGHWVIAGYDVYEIVPGYWSIYTDADKQTSVTGLDEARAWIAAELNVSGSR